MQRKASDVTRLIVSMYNGQPIWTPRNFEKLSKEGFEANVWVYRCVMAIATAVAGVDWTLYQVNGKTNKELEEHPLLDLIYKPNPFQSKKEFMEAITAFVLLSGNSYIEKNGPNKGAPKELYPLRPDRIKIMPDAANFVRGYIYEINGQKLAWDVNKVMHMKLFSAIDDYYGLAPLAVGAKAVDNDNAANTWNNSLLANAARPSGALVTKESLTQVQFDNLKAETTANYAGASRAGKFMLLEGGLDWKEMGLSPVDMDHINNKKMGRLEICAAFGVPPEIVGIPDAKTFANYAEARQSFYTETVLPMLDLIRDKFNMGVVPAFGEKLYLDYDRDGIEALQENGEVKAKRVREDYAGGVITLNEARAARGYESTKGGDVWQVPNAVRFVDENNNIILQSGGATGKTGGNDPNATGGSNGKSFFSRKAFNLTTEEQKANFWSEMDKQREQFYETVINQVQKRFKIEREAVLEAFKGKGLEAATKAVDAGADEWKKLFAAVDVMVMESFGNATFGQLKNEALDLEIKAPVDDSFNVFDKAVQEWIAETVALKVVQVTDTTKQAIRDHIAAGEAEGEGIPELAARIDTLYLDQIIPNRSTVIARTEVISSSNAGNRFAALQTDLPLEKEWIATRDDRTRSSHAHVDGQLQEMNNAYNVGGAKLMFPGDPKGPAKEVIQCRCTEGYSVKKKSIVTTSVYSETIDSEFKRIDAFFENLK